MELPRRARGDELLRPGELLGLAQTVRRTLGWAVRLMRGNIQRKTTVPASRIPMRSADGALASHTLPGTPQAELVQMNVKAPGESHKHSEESDAGAWPTNN